jgi:hypothetical protein
LSEVAAAVTSTVLQQAQEEVEGDVVGVWVLKYEFDLLRAMMKNVTNDECVGCGSQQLSTNFWQRQLYIDSDLKRITRYSYKTAAQPTNAVASS